MKNHHEKQPLDKSTAYDGSTEDPQDHASFYKDKPKADWFNIIAIPVILWVGLGFISAKYNIAQGDLKPHTWVLMNFSTAIVLMYWSALLFEWIVEKSYKIWWVKWIAIAVGATCFIVFIGSGLYIFKLAIEFIQLIVELLNK